MGNVLLRNLEEVPKNKKLIIFDLDGTLTESKSDMDAEMASLVGRLLETKKIAVIGGGKYAQFQEQLLEKLSVLEDLLANLMLFPVTATAFYKYEGGWKEVYSETLSEEEKKQILSAFDKTFQELGYKHPVETYGEVIEDRGTQMTFSALGQKAPLEIKTKWKEENSVLKIKITEILQKYLPDMEVRAAGYTSIDVTRKGIDKEYGIKKIAEHSGISLDDMLFVGDAFFEGGNDRSALNSGTDCYEVKNVSDTKKLIEYLLD